MSQHSKKFTRLAAFLIAFTIVATGCGSASSNEADGNVSSGNSQLETPSATDDPAATITPELVASASESPASDKPVEEKETESAATAKPTEKPAATAKPTEKPAATAKPTEKPAATAKPAEKPAATAKPAEKPAATAKPTNKPAATAKPTEKPAATPKPSEKPAAVKVADIVAKIKEDVELPMLFAMEGDYLKDMYGFDPSDLLSDGIFMGGMRSSSAELTVVQLKSDKDYDEVEKVLTERAESIIKTFETYLQDQHEMAQNYQIIRNGNYVLLSISDDQKGVAKAFNSFFK